jgi:N-methylhydantoinase B
MRTVDAITLSTTWHYIQRVCREMRETAERTATNVLVVTLHDLAYGIWDAEGRAVAIPEGFPVRLISSAFPIRKTKKKFEGNIHPGDIFLTNLPSDGAVHLADWVFIQPIFYKGELVFWTCMGTHVADNGGAHLGTHFLADDRVAEGLNIPIIKIMERGEWREDVAQFILANNRLPKMMRHEMSSLMGATAVAERRMVELLDRYGKETVYDCIEAMIKRTETAVRKHIKTWPEGTWEAAAQSDGEYKSNGGMITVRCKLTVQDGEATFDFSETDKECSANTNAHYHQTLSLVMCTTFLFLGSELAAFHNEGSMRPIHVITKKGTLVDCTDECLVAEAPAIVGLITTEVVLAVLSQALPELAIAPYSRISNPVLVGRDDSVDGLYVFSSFGANGGTGAVYGYDGYQCACDMSTLGVVGKSDCEDEMARFPWEIIRCEFNTDSHGAGKWRGCPGVIWEAVNVGSDCMNMGGPVDGFFTQGLGQAGGCPTLLNKAYVIHDGIPAELQEPRGRIPLKHGDYFLIVNGGGAGVGPAEERDPEAVLADVRNELVSVQMAREVYKVAIDPEKMQILEEETERLREHTPNVCIQEKYANAFEMTPPVHKETSVNDESIGLSTVF